MECPACRAQLDDVVWLPWGGVLSYDISRGPVYRVGSRLLWHLDASGQAPANTIWESARSTNLGDPSLRAVDVVAINVPERCPSCGSKVGGVRVSIRDGAITAVTVFEQRDVGPYVSAVVLDPESLEPTEELSINVPMRSIPGDPGALR